jgi:uncharacterized membrane protein AbrB (regulator of aidB expression)
MLQRFSNQPQKLFFFGMLAMVVGNIWPRYIHYPALSENWTDGLRGFFIGVSIALNLLAVRLLSRHRRCT